MTMALTLARAHTHTLYKAYNVAYKGAWTTAFTRALQSAAKPTAGSTETVCNSTTNKRKHMILNRLGASSGSETVLDQGRNSSNSTNSTIDFSNPAQWYPEARMMHRKIVMHVGPTNSGKTYRSLQKLAVSSSGYYAGPLRLLAREIFESFNSRGIACNLLTGEEIIPVVDSHGEISPITSGTIEMVPLHRKMDLCIIDEIQMMEDDMRGEAWTSALLGVQAREVHLCGEERAVELVRKIVRMTGDLLEIHRHERLGKLEVAAAPVKSVRQLAPGDCVVAFSKRKILELKLKIESQTKYRVAVVYGALPPEIRAEQARGFNDGTYQILVASDAVGMGLNLAIKRVVFTATEKFNGLEVVKLLTSSVRQIGGRAGRYSHDTSKSGGVVTAFKMSDLKFIRSNMNGTAGDISTARLWPTPAVWVRYLAQFPAQRSVLQILHHFSSTVVNSPIFELSNIGNRTEISELLMTNNLYARLSIEDQLRLSIAPISLRNPSELARATAYKFMENIAEAGSKTVEDFEFLPIKLLAQEPVAAHDVLGKLTALEECHKLVMTFMWLLQRWPYLFVDMESAYDWKSLVEKRITQELGVMRRRR